MRFALLLAVLVLLSLAVAKMKRDEDMLEDYEAGDWLRWTAKLNTRKKESGSGSGSASGRGSKGSTGKGNRPPKKNVQAASAAVNSANASD